MGVGKITAIAKGLTFYEVNHYRPERSNVMFRAKSRIINWFNGGNCSEVFNIDEADIVVFTGGEDIGTNLYNQKKNAYTTAPNVERDRYEARMFEKAVVGNKFIIGICRGAQLACVLSGGSLIQHCPHHRHGGHHIKDYISQQIYFVNSIHHQMMDPYALLSSEYEIIAYCLKKYKTTIKPSYIGEHGMEIIRNNEFLTDLPNFMEPELVYFPHTKSFCIQYHPEMMDGSADPAIQTALHYTNVKALTKFFGSKKLTVATNEEINRDTSVVAG